MGRVRLYVVPRPQLQWGRSTRAPENGEQAREVLRNPVASMGPEHEGSGKLHRLLQHR